MEESFLIFSTRNDRGNRMSPKEELLQCAVCEQYVDRNEAYRCPRCKKSPLCKKHRLPGKKECVSCTIELKLHEINALCGQEKSIRNFIRFIQFIFLVCAVFFITLKIGMLDEVDFLKDNIFSDNLIYIGIATLIFYVLSYIVLLHQKQKISAVQSEIDTVRFKKF